MRHHGRALAEPVTAQALGIPKSAAEAACHISRLGRAPIPAGNRLHRLVCVRWFGRLQTGFGLWTLGSKSCCRPDILAVFCRLGIFKTVERLFQFNVERILD